MDTKILPVAFLSILPAFVLAKERNIWKNEFADCPWWMRAFVIVSCIYGFLVALVWVVFRSGSNPTMDEVIPVSAFTFGLDMVGLCVLHSVLWSGSLNEAEVIKRARDSAIAVSLLLGLLLIPRR